MARFVFRLQSYLNLKEKLEDQKKLEYGRALAKVEEEKQKMLRLENDRVRQLEHFKESIQQKISPPELQNINNYIELLKKQIAEQEKVIKAAEEFAEKKRNELVEAMKERKMIDTLREKNHAEYMREEQIAEQKIVDEIVSYQYNTR